MSVHEPAVVDMAARTAPAAANISHGGAPHYGLLFMGGAMTSLGLPMLAIALLTPAHTVFIWIGMGIALGGGGCCSAAFLDKHRVPAGTRTNYGMLIQGGIMGVIGLALLISSLVVGHGFWSFHPGNVFIWIGMGLYLGGAGCCCAAWPPEPSKDRVRPAKPAKPKRLEQTGFSSQSGVLTTVLALLAPVASVVITIASGPWLRNTFSEFELTLPLLSNLFLNPVVPGIATALALVSMAMTIVVSFASSRRVSVGLNSLLLFFWGLLLAAYLLASLLPLATLIQGLS